MSYRFGQRAIVVSSLLAIIFAAGLSGLAWFAEADGSGNRTVIPVAEAEETVLSFPTVTHIETPDEVRGIYFTARTAGGARRDELVQYMLASGLNAAVIDLKMDDGEIAFIPQDVSLFPYMAHRPVIEDLDKFLRELGDVGIYRIARLPVMRDSAFVEAHPELALRRAGGNLWRDNIGSVWADPAAGEVADYALALAREAHVRGFDEVQFDYVRFPSDGATAAIVYPVYDKTETKSEIMRRFFKRVGEALRAEGIPTSFDVFGMTYWSPFDYNIGQRLLDVYPYADFVSPMVYPSHYPAGFEGYRNPAAHPYEIVKRSLDKGAEQLFGEMAVPEAESRGKARPWLQDFDIGAMYDAAKIEAQIRAARDAGASGWILWNARNVYEPANYGE